MLRIVHTSDWHLGHTLGDHDRAWEFDQFLAWLLDTLGEVEADALLIAGDIFETANPSARATAQWYRFLSAAHRRHPELQIVVIAGNHDSAARLDAPSPLLEEMKVSVVGVLPRDDRRQVDADRALVPLRDATGAVAAWVAAVPFLRPADLPGRHELGPRVHADQDDMIEGIRWVYDWVLDEARDRREPHQALIAMGHCYVAGGALSDLSERHIQRGNQSAIPGDVFGEDLAYAALGHLHKAQQVGAREHVRYSGSPLPLSVAERTYTHQVCVVDIDGPGPGQVTVRPIPRAVPVLKVPAEGTADLEAVEEALRVLPDDAGPREHWPWLQVTVTLTEPTPGVLPRVQQALAGRGVRLIEVRTEHPGPRGALADATGPRDLRTMTPEQVFRLRCEQQGYDPVPDDLIAAFHELLEAAAHSPSPQHD